MFFSLTPLQGVLVFAIGLALLIWGVILNGREEADSTQVLLIAGLGMVLMLVSAVVTRRRNT